MCAEDKERPLCLVCMAILRFLIFQADINTSSRFGPPRTDLGWQALSNWTLGAATFSPPLPWWRLNSLPGHRTQVLNDNTVFKTKHSIFLLLLYFTSPASHSKCYNPCQECPCYILERIRIARRKRQGSNHHKQNRWVVPSGTLRALCSIPSTFSSLCGGGGAQGIKCSTSVIEVMQNIQKKACKILIISRAGYSWGPASLWYTVNSRKTGGERQEKREP